MSIEIVIVGAGFAGVAAARKLGKKFTKNPNVNITLIDRHSYLTYMTELHEVAGGRIKAEAIKYDLKKLFGRLKNVQLVTDKVIYIDHEAQQIVAEHGTYTYDYLILSMGGEANDFGVKGVKENAFTLWSIEDAERIREHIIDMVYLAAREHDEGKRRALLSFLVCGAGFTGVEMIGEIVEWLPILAKQHKINPDEISYHLVEATPGILNTLTEKEQSRATQFMEKNRVQISLGDGIVAVDKEKVILSSGKEIPTFTTIWTAGVQANQEVAEWGFVRSRAGRIVVNEYMEAKGLDKVYVAGDMVYYEDSADDGKLIPQIVQAAEQTGDIAATSIISEITGTEKEAFKGNYDGNMVSIGSIYGVARLYDKYSIHGFVAMAIKHLANIKYFLSLGSWYYAWLYILHEILHVKDRRNIFKGHLSSHGNMVWLLFLRLFYGTMWLIEGLKKVFGLLGAESWFDQELMLPFAWLNPVNVISAASDAGVDTVEATAELTKQVFALNYTYGEEPMLVFSKMPAWFEAIMKVLVPNQEVALFMQKFISLVELGLGILLILGLFIWLVSAGTVALVVIFCLSGMFVWVNMWFIPVAIALMAGAGHSFGLDHYLIPWLQDKLTDCWFGKSKHIYSEGSKLA